MSSERICRDSSGPMARCCCKDHSECQVFRQKAHTEKVVCLFFRPDVTDDEDGCDWVKWEREE